MIDSEQARTIANIFVRSALAGVINRGIDCRPLLEQAGIPLSVMENPKLRVEPEPYSRLIQSICRELNDEFFGLSSRSCPPGAFAMMVQACITCASLRDALKRCNLFFSMVAPSFRCSLEVEGDDAMVVVEHLAPGEVDDHFLVESLLICLVRWGSWMIGRHILLGRVDFCCQEPRDIDEYNILFPCQRNYEQPVNRVVFSTRYLEMPVVQDVRALETYLNEVPGNFLTRYRHDDSLSAQIRRRLENMSYEDLPSFEDIARSLNMSTQTLRRRLKAEGNSYREIKDGIRRDIAVYHLLRQDLSINEIAEATGFAEPSTFHRAFKKWTGLTPGAWRDQRQMA